MVDHEKYRNDLLDGAVRAMAERGIEGTTTRAIADAVGLNEAYIYRYYLDRNDLLEKAFLRSDRNFLKNTGEAIHLLRDATLPFKERFSRFFDAIMEYANSDHSYCQFYVRYYFSKLYTKKVRDEHMKIVAEYIPEPDVIKPDANYELLQHMLFISVLSYIMDVSADFHEDTAESRAKLCDFLYLILIQELDTEKIPNF